ncbi:MAG: DUF4267 domain-containing protein [Thermomicrobiales bacterium]
MWQKGTAPIEGGDRQQNLAPGISVLMSLGIIGIGARYLVDPEASAATFGVPDWPRGDARAFLAVKGVRDIASGLLVLILLALGQRRALGWVLLAIAIVPAGELPANPRRDARRPARLFLFTHTSNVAGETLPVSPGLCWRLRSS